MRNLLVWATVVLMILAVPSRAMAGFSPSRPLALPEVDRAADLEQIRAVLEEKVVRQHLSELGFGPADIEKRLGDYSDQQIHRLATDLDEMRTGGSALGVIIAVLVIILLVVLIFSLFDDDEIEVDAD